MLKRRILAVVGAITLGLITAGTANATARLTVKDSSTAANITFKVEDNGTTVIKGSTAYLTTQDDAGNTLFWVNPGNGRIGIGSSSPNAALWLKGNVANNIQIVSFYSGTTTNSGGGGIVIGHSGNVAAGEHYARTNDRLGYLLFASGAANGYTFRNGGGISAYAEGPFSDTSMPTYFTFATAPTTGGSTRYESLRITANGNLVAGNLGGAAAAPMGTADIKGFLYVPTVAGALTSCGSTVTKGDGTTTTVGQQYNGHAPIWFDSTNNMICACNGTTRKCTAAMN